MGTMYGLPGARSARASRAAVRLVAGAAGAAALLVGTLSSAAVATTAPVAKIVIAPTPIAPDGSLHAGQVVVLTVTAENATGRPLGGATVYLWFATSAAGASIETHDTSLTGTPTAYRTNMAGTIIMSYHAAGNPLPTTGASTVAAANAPSGATVVASDNYVYSPSTKVTSYSASPTPIAAAHTLVPGAQAPVTITAKNGGTAVPHAPVFLSFTPGSGGGTAYAHGRPLSSVPQLFYTGTTGTITVTYRAPYVIPASGTDTLTFANAATGATVSGTDTYSF